MLLDAEDVKDNRGDVLGDGFASGLAFYDISFCAGAGDGGNAFGLGVITVTPMDK